MKKKLYENPEAELFEVRFEENLMQSNYGESGSAGGKQDYNLYEEDF